MENDLANYFVLLSEQDNPPVIELQNNKHEPIGALYLNKIKDMGRISIVACNNKEEKYFLVCDGIAIFFSYFRKVINK